MAIKILTCLFQHYLAQKKKKEKKKLLSIRNLTSSLFTKPNQTNIIKKTQKFLPLSLPKYSPIKPRTSKQTNQIGD